MVAVSAPDVAPPDKPKKEYTLIVGSDGERTKCYWDGVAIVAIEIYVCPEGDNRPIIGATVTLHLDKKLLVTRERGYVAPSAQTSVTGAVTFKGRFPAGGMVYVEGMSAGVRLGESVIRCEAPGYQPAAVTLPPQLTFEPGEPQVMKVTVEMKRR